MTNIDSIIFDLDGTLWDSTKLVAKAWNQAIAEDPDLNLTITAETLKPLFGQLMPDIAKSLFPDCSREHQLQLIDRCCQIEHEILLKTCAPLYDRLEETLEALSSSYPLYIVSNCQTGYIEVFLQTSGLDHHFDDHLCPGDTGNPKAENIKEIIRKHHLKAPVYVGDTEGDYKAAKAAEVPFVFASYGFGSVDTPDYTIQNLYELTKEFL